MTIEEIVAERGARLARANGIDIAYTDTGDGPPLVLLHVALASTGPAWSGSPVAHVDHLAAAVRFLPGQQLCFCLTVSRLNTRRRSSAARCLHGEPHRAGSP